MLDRAAARARLAETIAADYTTLACELILACPPPEGHRWDVSHRRELRWWCNDVIESTRFGASVFVHRIGADDHDPDQVHVEVRWFWKNDGSDRESRRIRHEAILWCERGSRVVGRSRNLLDAGKSFPKAETIEELAATIALTLRRVLWP